MPRGDRTGPAGAGPMTGRGLGYCAGYSTPGFTKGYPRGGGGFGRGFWGRGRGFRGGPGWGAYGPGYYGPYPSYPPAPTTGRAGYYPPAGAPAQGGQSEVEYLQDEAKVLEQQLEEIRARLDELQGEEE